jgi:phosphoribosylformimino-5-aminoimidazole carboxamide ribotide isomerase
VSFEVEVIPAIDIQRGKCVRLLKGLAGSETVYYENPLDAALFWQNNMGVTRLHLVDLDAAMGVGDNTAILVSIMKHLHIKIQIGGGIHTLDKALLFIKSGADRIIVGTTAVKDPSFIPKLAQHLERDQIIVSLDHRNGNVAVKGWTENSGKNAFNLAQHFERAGVGYILFSAVDVDGTLQGPDLINTKKMVESVNIPVYAAGGTRNKVDILALKDIGAHGVIIGKAFYENQLDFRTVKDL